MTEMDENIKLKTEVCELLLEINKHHRTIFDLNRHVTTLQHRLDVISELPKATAIQTVLFQKLCCITRERNEFKAALDEERSGILHVDAPTEVVVSGENSREGCIPNEEEETDLLTEALQSLAV